MGFTHFYGDPHYGHANIIHHAERPFSSVGEMDAELEKRYREVVGPDDFVLWLGDVAFAPEPWISALLERLPGRKALILGNHDGTIARCLRLGFEFVSAALYFSLNGHKVTACHYPPWNGPATQVLHPERRPLKPGPGEFVLHGHTHEKERRMGQRLHVGVDAWDFAPASRADIEALIV